ncbi:MAG: divergent polysaccharide deacetylase family protein [Desulfocapsa sp.]|nr:divergent polysaccharide deacetylase family protein [Desulfocapsa sp.]
MKKETSKKRKTPARRRKKSSKRKLFTSKLFSFLALFGFLLFSMAFAGYVIFFRTTIANGATVQEEVADITFEEPYPDIPELPSDIPPVSDASLPMVAIIIDDMGYHKDIGKELLALPMNLTFSFLAAAPHTLELEEQAFQTGRNVLLHLPMQPKGKEWDSGPASLLTGQTREEQKTVFEKNLAAVPHAVGVNNHMGSLYTENRAAMDTLMELLREQDLFFVDSFTTADSKGFIAAREAGLPTVRRHVFLDNVHSQDKVCKQLQQLVARAEKQGWALGIGHPNEATLAALTNCRVRLLERARLVSVQELVGELNKR